MRPDDEHQAAVWLTELGVPEAPALARRYATAHIKAVLDRYCEKRESGAVIGPGWVRWALRQTWLDAERIKSL